MKISSSITDRIGLTLALTLGAWTTSLYAQPGSLDTNFNAVATAQPDPSSPFGTHIGYSVAVQADGKVIAVGTFGVMRFLHDGSVDPTFQPIPPGPTQYPGGYSRLGAVKLQPDGRIIVTGSFSNSAGGYLPGLMRLNSNGTIDSSFNLDPRVQTAGRVLAVQLDGKILTGGFYYRADEDAGSLVRLLRDGSLDPDWDARWSANDSGVGYYSLATTPEGKIYFGGNGIGRVTLGGSRDESFNPEPGLGPWAALAVQPDGKVLVGQYGDGPGFRSMRRLLDNGADDPTWTVPSFNGGDHVIYAVVLQPDGKVLVGGHNLESFNGGASANLGRLHADGSVDTTFDSRGDLHFYTVEDMVLGPDGKVLVAGYHLDRPNLTPAPSIWRLNNDAGPRGIEFTTASHIAYEGDGWMDVPVRRTTDTDKLAVVGYAVRSGTATRWRDYFGGDGVLVFRPGETHKKIRLYVVRDRKSEGFETVRLTLVRARGGSIGPQRTATLTILDK